VPEPFTSNTSIGSRTLTLVGPSGLTLKNPSHSLRAAAQTASEPVGASACIREAKLVEWPIGAYSAWPSPIAIERTTTSPVFTPTQALWVDCQPCAVRPSSAASLLGCGAHVQGTLRMVFEGERRAKQGEDPVTWWMYDVAAVTVHRVADELERWI
jgi:hypothetical protein